MEKRGLRWWTKKVKFLSLWVVLRLWVVIRLWKNRVYGCGQVLRLWVVYVCGRYNTKCVKLGGLHLSAWRLVPLN